jgi:hypothetical protein
MPKDELGPVGVQFVESMLEDTETSSHRAKASYHWLEKLWYPLVHLTLGK